MAHRIRRARLGTAFAAIYLLWGSTYLAVALGLRSIPPFLLMGGRSVVAGGILMAVSWLRTGRPPPPGAWVVAAVGGLLLFVGCHGTLAYAQQHVPSGLAAVMLATVPFWIVLLNSLVPPDGERPQAAAALVAMAPGLAGVALIAWRGAAGEGGAAIAPLMTALLLGAALSWAAGTVVSQRHGSAISAIDLSGMQLICGGVVLLAVSAAAGEIRDFSLADVSVPSWAAVAYLAVAGSVVAFTAYVWLLDHVPGPLVATYTFVNPVIAVVLGWAVLGERPGAGSLVGMALVIASVAAVWRLDSIASPRR